MSKGSSSVIQKEIVVTPKAPAPVGPYSQAVRVGEFVFLSGQIPLDPTTNQVIQGDVKAQTKRVLENLIAVLEASHASLQTVVKTTIFLKNMGDFTQVNEVYANYFETNPPARSTIEVARLPKDVLVEIEALALVAP